MLGIEGVSNETDVSKVKNEVIDDDIEVDLRNNIPEIIPIRCGTLGAKMHVKLFVCPGIHQPCIELENDPDLITPKAFTIRANKDRQKDWKGSIRIGKSNLRTLMEMRSFDFHNHANFCSAKCQSRNYITPKEAAFAFEREDSNILRRASVGATPTFVVQTPSPSKPEIKPTLGALFKNPQFSQFIQLSQALRNNNNLGTQSTPPSQSTSASRTSALLAGIQKFTKEEQSKITIETEHLCSKMSTDPIFFWSEMQHLGLSEQIIDQMVETLNQMRIKLKHGSINNVAPFLSRSIASLGVCDRVVAAVRRRNSMNADALQRLSAEYPQGESSDIIKAKPQSITEQLEALIHKKPTSEVISSRKKSIADQLEALVARKTSLAQTIVKIEPPEMPAEEKPFARKRSIDVQLETHTKKPRKTQPTPTNTTPNSNGTSAHLMDQFQSPSEILMQLAASINPTATSSSASNENPTIQRDSLLVIK